jgi:hypothetical protein
MPRASEPHERHTLCTSCNGPLTVATMAKSVVCIHCHARVVTEALDVDGYVAVRRFATANRMHVGKKGIVFAEIRADDLVVDGTLTGDCVSMTRIHVGKTARVKGALRALTLALDAGAEFAGEVRIGPDHVPELEALRPGDAGTTPAG